LVHPFQKTWEENVRKTYQAIVFGRFPPGQKRLEAPIGQKKDSPIRMKLWVEEARGKPSVTEFRLMETRGDFSLVEAKILTGRTHQIRVHLEHLKYPIVGDKLYSGGDETFLHFYEKGWDDWLKERVLLSRMALHACGLEFTHVRTGEKFVFGDPLPEDLMIFWNGLKKS
jgi:23S rRNA-/tRNA-specific pseudouridylate synthase